MIESIKRQFVKILRETADKIDAGNSEINEEQAIQVMSLIAHEPISREEASMELNVSRTKFNNMIDEGIVPKGRKRFGLKELIWYRDEIRKIKNLL